MSKFFAAMEFDPVTIVIIVAVVLVFVGMIIMPMFTKKRQNNQVNDLYSNLSSGDEVMTIGGIVGTVIKIEETSPVDKKILIETGAEGNKTTIWLDIKGIYQNLSKPAVETNFFGKPKTEAAATAVIKAEPEADFSKDESFNGQDVPKED